MADHATEETPIRVLIVDDLSLQRMGLRMIVDSQTDMTVVGEAADGRSAVLQARSLRPDVILMDIRMPHQDGLWATERIISDDPGVRVLVLTMFDLDEYAYPALRSGASGFLLKDTPPEGIISAIRSVTNGEAIVAPTLTRRLLDSMGEKLWSDTEEDKAPERTDELLSALTPREREVLIEVANGRSNAEIAEKLQMAEATVKTHIGRILAKTGLRDRVQVVIFAYDARLVSPSSD